MIWTISYFQPQSAPTTYISGSKVRAEYQLFSPFLTFNLDTLIVWTEPDGVDYALSFQETEGCSEVWNFISEVQQHMKTSGA